VSSGEQEKKKKGNTIHGLRFGNSWHLPYSNWTTPPERWEGILWAGTAMLLFKLKGNGLSFSVQVAAAKREEMPSPVVF